MQVSRGQLTEGLAGAAQPGSVTNPAAEIEKILGLFAHAGNCGENLGEVAESMNRFLTCMSTSRPVPGELSRQPRTARNFFETYQDRIVFGTDRVPHAETSVTQIFGDELYQIYCRFLETRTSTSITLPYQRPRGAGAFTD